MIMIHDLRMNLNPTLPQQKQHSTKRPFDQKLGIKFKEETSKVVHLDHSFVWCGNLDSFESKSELIRTYLNVVLQKDRDDHLD